MDYKSQLNQYCQKTKQSAPEYKTERIGGDDHAPSFRSSLVINDKRVIGDEAPTKKTAEQNVAQRCLSVLLDSPQEKEEKGIAHENILISEEDGLTLHLLRQEMSFSSVIVLVDLENYPKVLESSLIYDESYYFIGVIGHCHALLDKPIPFPIYVVETSGRDAADHGLTFLSGLIQGFIEPEQKLFVLTRDHYAEATVSCLCKMGVDATHIPSMKNLKKLN